MKRPILASDTQIQINKNSTAKLFHINLEKGTIYTKYIWQEIFEVENNYAPTKQTKKIHFRWPIQKTFEISRWPIAAKINNNNIYIYLVGC